MKTGFIGAGKVGFSLGKMFAESGLPLTGYYSRQREAAQEAAAFTGTRAYSDLCELVQDSDAIFLTVPDRAITPVYLELRSFSLSGKQICHCSGALSARDAFPGIEETGALGLSIHPLFPVSSRYDSYRELADAFFCLEGEKSAIPAWKTQLECCGCTVQTIDAAVKPLYHAACATASNLVCALVQQSIDELTRCGFSQGRCASRTDAAHPQQHRASACGRPDRGADRSGRTKRLRNGEKTSCLSHGGT